jgi:hypothetical protein
LFGAITNKHKTNLFAKGLPDQIQAKKADFFILAVKHDRRLFKFPGHSGWLKPKE